MIGSSPCGDPSPRVPMACRCVMRQPSLIITSVLSCCRVVPEGVQNFCFSQKITWIFEFKTGKNSLVDIFFWYLVISIICSGSLYIFCFFVTIRSLSTFQEKWEKTTIHQSMSENCWKTGNWTTSVRVNKHFNLSKIPMSLKTITIFNANFDFPLHMFEKML